MKWVLNKTVIEKFIQNEHVVKSIAVLFIWLLASVVLFVLCIYTDFVSSM